MGGLAFSVASQSLSALLRQARELLDLHSSHHSTARGAVRSINGVALTWQAPQTLAEPGLRWSGADVDWYLRTFVHPSELTDPQTTPARGQLLFPYTYAARSRFWDGGWAYFHVMLVALKQNGFSIEHACRSKRYFRETVRTLGQSVHLQNVLALMSLYGPQSIMQYEEQIDFVRGIMHAWRRDNVRSAIDELRGDSQTRRAVVSSFSYPQLERQLRPTMSKPPYQLFQFLPADEHAAISTVHEHRSLDLLGGAQLDFSHDYSWLTEASLKAHRPIGDITIIAHNLHEYRPDAQNGKSPLYDTSGSIEDWLCSVTDAYKVCDDTTTSVVAEPAYAANIDRIYARWRRASHSSEPRGLR